MTSSSQKRKGGRSAANSQSSPGRSSGFEQGLQTATDCSFVLAVVLAPCFMGGRHPLGALVFIACCCLISLLVSVRQWLYPVARRLNLLDLVLIAGVVLVLVQLLPLPSSLLHWISPGLKAALPLWQGAEGETHLGTWQTVSLVPTLTRQSLGVFLGYVMFYFSATFHFRDMVALSRAIKLIAVSCVLMAFLGIAQGLFGNGKFLWVYDPPYRSAGRLAQGPFINPNHFAHFLALGIGPLIWWLSETSGASGLAKRDRRRAGNFSFERTKEGQDALVGRAVLMSLIGVVIAAGVLSNSRGGVLVLGLALLTAFSLVLFHGKRVVQAVGGMALALVLAGALVWSQGHEAILSEMQTVNFDSVDGMKESAGREVPWKAVMRGFPNHWVLGSGAGTFREVYKLYSDRFMTHECTHAESGYFQIALETGIVGLLLLFAGIFAVGRWLRTCLSGQNSHYLVAIVPGLLISLVHSFVDFVWYIPACATLLILLVAVAFRAAHGVAVPMKAKPVTAGLLVSGGRGIGLTAMALTLMASLLVLRPALTHVRANAQWESYLNENQGGYLADNSFGTDYSQALTRLDQVSSRLQECVRLDPSHYRARLRLAETLLHKFEISQRISSQGIGIADINDAAIRSGYSKHTELKDWLEQATGERHGLLYEAQYQARMGTRLSPLSGEGYLCLSQLSFLYPELQWDALELIDQAIAVRPFDGEVLFGAAAMTNQRGTAEQTTELIQRALRRDPGIRRQIVAQVGPQLPFQQFVELVRPDRPALVLLIRQYNSVERRAEAAEGAEMYFEAVDAELDNQLAKSDRAKLLKEASQISFSVGAEEKCVAYERAALKADPNDFRLRLQHARRLAKLGENEEAARHLRWCVARRPDQGLKTELRDVLVR